MTEIREQAVKAAEELCDAAGLKKGQILVVGCSSSEIIGKKIGSCSSEETAQEVYDALQSVLRPRGIYLAAQCCEHLNRAIIIEAEAVPGAEICNVVPQPKAGGSFATAAYNDMKNPVALEEIKADAGRKYTDWNASEKSCGSCSAEGEIHRRSSSGCSENQTEIYRRLQSCVQ